MAEITPQATTAEITPQATTAEITPQATMAETPQATTAEITPQATTAETQQATRAETPQPTMAETPQPQPQPQPQLEIRFRIMYGRELFQEFFPLSTTIDSIKERILSEWPQDLTTQPTSVDDIRLMHAGNPLASGRTIGEHRFLIIPGDVVTVLVIVLPPEFRRRAVDTSQDSRIGCTACCNLL